MLKLENSDLITVQDYEPQKLIQGVSLTAINTNIGLGNNFTELLRLNNGYAELPDNVMDVQQISLVNIEPNFINAFHIHHKSPQREIWIVSSGKLRVCLVDTRSDSPTKNVINKFTLSFAKPQLLYIPAYVAHGYKSGAAGATLIYFSSEKFDKKNPNEGRIDKNAFGNDIFEEDT